MQIPTGLIVNADDFGFSESVNKAILYCFDRGYINSTSLMAANGENNNDAFDEAIEMIHANASIKNIGLHVNLDTGRPLSDFKIEKYLTGDGYWDEARTGKKISFLDTVAKKAFTGEIEAQLSLVKKAKVNITHIDSHHHLHTLPTFYPLFLAVAKSHNVKLRLAQTYDEGNYLKFAFRKYVNRKVKNTGCNYSDRFETIEYFLKHNHLQKSGEITELMLHPIFDSTGLLTDHYSVTDMANWLTYLNNLK